MFCGRIKSILWEIIEYNPETTVFDAPILLRELELIVIRNKNQEIITNRNNKRKHTFGDVKQVRVA